MPLLSALNIFTPFGSVFIADFKQLNFCGVRKILFSVSVSAQSIRVNEKTITGKVEGNIDLRWTFDIPSPNTTNIAAIDLILGDEYNLDRLLFKNITPILQPFGNKTFGNRISASFLANIYTVRLIDIKSNESSSFFLNATIERIASGNRSSLQVSAVIDLMVENNTEMSRGKT